MKLPIVLMVALAGALPAAAQLPWKTLDGLAAKAKESVEITLDASTLQMAQGLFGGKPKKPKDEQVNKILENLKGITVRVFEFTSEGQYDPGVLDNFREQLRMQGWSKTMEAKDSRESFALYSRSEQGKIVGFAMIASGPKELAVIHFDGAIDLADVASLGGQLGIPRFPVELGTPKGKE